MQLTYQDELRYMQFPGLRKVPGIWHGAFVRRTVGPDGLTESFNLGLNGDEPEKEIWHRRRRIMAAAGARGAVFARQVHGTKVAVFEGAPTLPEHACGEDAIRLAGDALVTAVPQVALFIQTADCQSVLIVDPVKQVVANVHSGWRGSIGNIVGRTVQTMVDRFGSRPRDLHGGIGPSLGPCCAEFIHYRREIPGPYWRYRRQGDLFDFWRMSADQLAETGVPRQQIAASGICTRCNRHLFFSYRGEGGGTGRFAAVVMLKNASAEPAHPTV